MGATVIEALRNRVHCYYCRVVLHQYIIAVVVVRNYDDWAVGWGWYGWVCVRVWLVECL